MKTVFIIGASRGLGRSVAHFLPHFIPTAQNVVLFSRKSDELDKTKNLMTSVPLPGIEHSAEANKHLNSPIHISTEACDLAKAEGQDFLSEKIHKLKPDLVIYAAGGGPHGAYHDKEWKDHEWALQLGLVAPMRLTSEWLKARKNHADAGKFVIVGSRIAEQSPDPLASSYAAAKHGLMGFVSSLQKELEGGKSHVWLFSPGYMDTQMLPQTAPVRHDGSKILTVETAAQALLRWVVKDGPWHRVLA